MPDFAGRVFFIIPKDNLGFLSGCCFSFSTPSMGKKNILVFYDVEYYSNKYIPLAEISISFDSRFDMIQWQCRQHSFTDAYE